MCIPTRDEAALLTVAQNVMSDAVEIISRYEELRP